MTLAGAARLMRSLGARDALNLDGGGSTTMTVGGQVVNRPSDRAGERPVSNALYVTP
jgi:exopolysaccharide biosynthesis protein